jgi:hypothetical protein
MGKAVLSVVEPAGSGKVKVFCTPVVDAYGIGKAVLSVVEPAGKGKVIMFCKPIELVARVVKV